MRRIAGDMDIYLSKDDDTETRRQLLGYVIDNILQTLSTTHGKSVSVKIMFDAEVSS